MENPKSGPTWVDHLLDDWTSFMRGETDFDSVCKKIEELNGESCTDAPWNLYWEELFNKYPDSKVILTIRDSGKVLEPSKIALQRLKRHGLIQIGTSNGVSNSKLFKDEVWYKSFRKYLESVQATGVLAGPDVEYYKQDQQYAKVKKSLPIELW